MNLKTITASAAIIFLLGTTVYFRRAYIHEWDAHHFERFGDLQSINTWSNSFYAVFEQYQRIRPESQNRTADQQSVAQR